MNIMSFGKWPRLLLFAGVAAVLLEAQAPPSSVVQTSTPGVIGDNGTTVSVTGRNVAIGTTVLSQTSGVLMPVTISTSGPVAIVVTGFYINNATGALTYTLPVITSANIGAQFCIRNATTRTGVLTVTAPASTFLDVNGVNGTAAGTLVSGGAVGDSVCVLAISTTQYLAYVGTGFWVNN